MTAIDMTEPPVIERPEAKSARFDLQTLYKHARLLLLPLITAAIIIGAWEAIVRIKNIPEVLLPAPSVIAVRLIETLPFLLKQAVPTTLETIGGFLISLVLGVGLAVLVSASRFAREALYPNIVFFQLIPKIALAPLFIVWLGIGSESRVTFSVFISFFPVVVATLTGLTSVDRDLLRLCKASARPVPRSIHASAFRRLFHTSLQN